MAETVKIKSWGNSQGIIISKKRLREIGIDDPLNQEFYITTNKKSGEIILKRKKSSRLMNEYGKLAKHQPQPGTREADFGQPVGKEII